MSDESVDVKPSVLILFAHPALQKSRVNVRLAAAVRDLPGVTFRDLYEEYPDFGIHVREEQELLVAHETVVFQHPFHWYSGPALLKEWLDLVLEYNFAYGEKGTALRGKRLLTATTTGGAAESYGREGYNHYTVRELLAPFEQTAKLCGMEYLEPFIINGAIGLTGEPELAAAAARYRERVAGLVK